MKLHVEPLSATEVLVEIEGLQPGEKPLLIFRATAPGLLQQDEVQLARPVGPNGHFVLRKQGLERLPGKPVNRWEVKIVHRRGVACTEVVLP